MKAGIFAARERSREMHEALVSNREGEIAAWRVATVDGLNALLAAVVNGAECIERHHCDRSANGSVTVDDFRDAPKHLDPFDPEPWNRLTRLLDATRKEVIIITSLSEFAKFI